MTQPAEDAADIISRVLDESALEASQRRYRLTACRRCPTCLQCTCEGRVHRCNDGEVKYDDA